MQEEERQLGISEVQATRRVIMAIDKEKCAYPKCKLCMENCPVDGIDLTVKPAVIGKPCIGCSFCMKICPTGALSDVGMGMMKMPSGKEGEIRGKLFKEHYIDYLARAEAEGRFRRLIPMEEVVLHPPMD